MPGWSKSSSLLHLCWCMVTDNVVSIQKEFRFVHWEGLIYMCVRVMRVCVSLCSKPGISTSKSCPRHKAILCNEDKFFCFVWHIAWKLRVKIHDCKTSSSSLSMEMEKKLIRNSFDQLVNILNMQSSFIHFETESR